MNNSKQPVWAPGATPQPVSRLAASLAYLPQGQPMAGKVHEESRPIRLPHVQPSSTAWRFPTNETRTGSAQGASLARRKTSAPCSTTHSILATSRHLWTAQLSPNNAPPQKFERATSPLRMPQVVAQSLLPSPQTVGWSTPPTCVSKTS